jgi:hypothetical protein
MKLTADEAGTCQEAETPSDCITLLVCPVGSGNTEVATSEGVTNTPLIYKLSTKRVAPSHVLMFRIEFPFISKSPDILLGVVPSLDKVFSKAVSIAVKLALRASIEAYPDAMSVSVSLAITVPSFSSC